MSLRSKLVVLCVLLALPACGFQPVHSKAAQPGIAPVGIAVEVSAPDRLSKERLTAELEDRLNPGGLPAQPAYRLNVQLSSSVGAIGVARDGTVSRYNVNLLSSYTLTREGEKEPLTSGGLRSVSSYNNLTNQYYSTYISEQDAIRRGIGELAELYAQRLAPVLAEANRP
jgi:LPS-assembly lipoprotein